MKNSKICCNIRVHTNLPSLFQLKVTSDKLLSITIEPNVLEEERWNGIHNLVKVNLRLGQQEAHKLWNFLKEYVDVFIKHKGKLDCCMVGEHCIETHGFPPCCTTPNRLSLWEEAKVNQQI